MAYTRPPGDAADFAFGGAPYIYPASGKADFGAKPPAPTILAQGFDSADLGKPGAWNYRQHVVAGGIPPRSGYGAPTVWLYTRYLAPPGLDAQRHGTQWASHYLRYITSPGAGDALKNGAPWVSRSPRHLEPTGVKPPEVMGSHVVGGTRHLFPAGTEMTGWGTRIIPEGQVTYPQGFAGEAGNPGVELHTRYLRPNGFATNTDSLRFGYQHAWNLRQYVQQDYDPNDGLSPPPFGQ